VDDDHRFAADLATETGELLVRLRSAVGFADPRRLRAEGDAQAQALIAARLAAHRPGDAVLSEEAPDSSARLEAERVWIIDPLDGTREFGEAGRTDWAVHVALWSRGHGLVVGAVALPARGITLRTDRPVAPAGQDGPARVVVSRTRAVPEAVRVVSALDGVTVPMGSAGAKVAAVVLGDADVYLHSGGMNQWDSAAPVAVALAAGLHASRLDGTPLVYNGPEVSLPDLIVCRPELASAVTAAVNHLAE
jgi:3'(2'), 5'-bisphosphate nucleotidase